MKQFLLALGLVASVSANAAPAGWINVPGTNVYREQTAMVYGNNRGAVYRAEVWAWTQEQEYIKITVGCSYDSYRVEKDNKEILSSPYNPGHAFWSIKKAFCY
jgi:hypothetical protein